MAERRKGPVPDFDEILPMLLAERKQVPADQENYVVEASSMVIGSSLSSAMGAAGCARKTVRTAAPGSRKFATPFRRSIVDSP